MAERQPTPIWAQLFCERMNGHPECPPGTAVEMRGKDLRTRFGESSQAADIKSEVHLRFRSRFCWRLGLALAARQQEIQSRHSIQMS
jgi:hypothetical protein